MRKISARIGVPSHFQLASLSRRNIVGMGMSPQTPEPHVATACRILAARGRQPPEPISVEDWKFSPQTEEEAYLAQDYFVKNCAALNYGNPVGFKIGATNQGARDGLKLPQPFYGVLFQGLSSRNGSTIDASRMFLRVVEPEIALELSHDIDASTGPVDAEAVKKATARVFPAIEVVDSVFGSRWKELGGLNVIADNGAHGQWIRGEGNADPSKFDAEGVKVTLEVNGKLEREGSGAAVEGGAFAGTAWLANFLASRGVPLRKGSVISTGTTTVPWMANAGDNIVVKFEGLGEVQLSFQ